MSAIEFSVIDTTGDTKTLWDASRPAEVEAARSMFAMLVTEKKYLAFRVTDKDGKAGEQVRTFDPSHERLIFTPPMQGG